MARTVKEFVSLIAVCSVVAALFLGVVVLFAHEVRAEPVLPSSDTGMVYIYGQPGGDEGGFFRLLLRLPEEEAPVVLPI